MATSGMAGGTRPFKGPLFVNVTTTLQSTTRGFVGRMVRNAEQAGTTVDTAMWFTGRLTQVIVIGVIVGLLIGFRKQVKMMLQPLFEKCRETRCRHVKGCCVRRCCSCCPFGNSSSDKTYTHFTDARETLTVTLIAASGVQKPKSFYVELWSEPQEAASRTSQTHQYVQGDAHLGLEKISLDWYGDEDRVIVQIVEFPKVGKEKPIGEIDLSRAQILRYAEEASKARDDVNAGSRRFDVCKLDEYVARMRKKKVKTPGPTNVVLSYLVTKAQERVGLGVALAEDEALELQRKNAELESQVASLQTQLQQSATGSSLSSPGKAPREVIMGLVLRFEITQRNAGPTVDHTSFKQASFREDDLQPRSMFLSA